MIRSTPTPTPTSRPAPAPSPHRLLVPHEHGAYGQLAVPLATALALGRPTLASAALALASILGFVAHEPLLVVLGRRGRRALEEDGARARRALGWVGLAGLLLGAAGLLLAPAAARWALLVPVLLAGAVGGFVWRKAEKTVAGEIGVAAALSACGLPVALAGGVSPARAAACWSVWVIAFTAATLAVKSLLARARSRGGRNPGPAAAAAVLALIGLACAAAVLAALPLAAPLALAPVAALALLICLFPVPARRLREIGWAMVGASLLTMTLLVAGLR